MVGSKAQQAAIAISMKKAGKKPKMQKGGSKVKSGPDYRHMSLVHWTDDYNTKKDSADYRKGYYQGVNDIKQGKPKSKTLYKNFSGPTTERFGYSEAYERNQPTSKTKKPTKMKSGGSTPAWTRKEGKSESGGLNAKGVASYRRENPGSKLQTAVTTKPSKLDPDSKAAKRRRRFCSRMSGMKKKNTSAKTANDPNSRINKSLRKWNC